MTHEAAAGTGGRVDARWLYNVLVYFEPSARRSLSLVAIVSFAGGLAEAATLVVVTSLAVNLTRSDAEVTLGPVHLDEGSAFLFAGALIVAGLLLSVWLARLIARTTTAAGFAARQQLLSSFHRSSYQRKSRDRLALLQEALTTYVDRLMNAFGAFSGLAASVLSLAGFAVAALIVDPAASVALAVIGALMLAVLRPATNRTRAASAGLAMHRRRYAEGATESVLLARELSVFGVTETAGAHLQSLDQLVAEQFRRSRFLSVLTPRIYQALAFGLIVIGLASIQAVETSDLSGIGAVVLLLVRSMSYGQQILTNLQAISEHRPFVEQLVDLEDSYRQEHRRQGLAEVTRIGSLELRDVGFSYGDESAALSGVDLQINRGETIGIVGPSGAGKTTLVNLLLRLYEPSEGAILADGVSTGDIRDESWHAMTAIVPQEPLLLHGTIADNIRFLRDLPAEALDKAAVDAHLTSFLDELPLGIDTPVGEQGMGLSGGQRQRVCIARALAGDPELLVLDEPTSALDGDSEAAIQQTLGSLKGRVTMVVVAHRLSTLTICDRLVVMIGGRVVDVGTADYLRDHSTYFREAVRLAGL